jgi:hypothetical protein
MSEPVSEVSTNNEPVEIWFKLVKASDGYPESQDWEELWAQPIGHNYRLESAPFFEKRVSKGDLVSASLQGEGFLQFEHVIERGRHSTFRALIDLRQISVEFVIKELDSLGAECEVTLNSLVSIDVPEAALSKVEEFLVRGKDKGKWGLEDGFIFEPSRDSS